MSILSSPFTYYAAQAPNNPITTADFPGQALGLTLALGNLHVLLALLAVICSWTKHPEITKRYLLAVAVADIGHIYATYRAVGSEFFLNFREWNDMVWANVGVVLFLLVNRMATLSGAFGKIARAAHHQEKGKK